jgi:hypothetical protein
VPAELWHAPPEINIDDLLEQGDNPAFFYWSMPDYPSPEDYWDIVGQGMPFDLQEATRLLKESKRDFHYFDHWKRYQMMQANRNYPSEHYLCLNPHGIEQRAWAASVALTFAKLGCQAVELHAIYAHLPMEHLGPRQQYIAGTNRNKKLSELSEFGGVDSLDVWLMFQRQQTEINWSTSAFMMQ